MDRGYVGAVLWVDLTSGELHEEVIPDVVYEKYLSGIGLAAYILYHRIPADADPLGPSNIIGFVSGLLTGTGSLFSGRWMVVGKSPLTGGWGDANCGGNFAPAIKNCGYDAIFFSGISPKPVYFYADGKSAEIRDARHLWGKDTTEAEDILIQTAGGKRRPRIASIGPAGEKKSLISGVVNDKGRLAARSGLGAVMGAKRLKALALAGAHRVRSRDREAMKRLSLQCNEHVKWQPPFFSGTMTAHMGALMRHLPTQIETDGMLYKIMLKKWGTISMNQMSIEMGDAPIKNWAGSNKDFGRHHSKLVNPDLVSERVIAKYYCHSCPLGCGGLVMDSGREKEVHRPEYETFIALGGLLMNEDADSIFYMNERLNRAGMDTISAGGSVAMAIECYENGLIDNRQTGNLELRWGNTQAIVELIEKMIAREGIGAIFADGVKQAASRIGKHAERFAMHAGGQELGMHDGRYDPGFAVHNTVEPTPGRHTIGSQLYYEMYRLWKKMPYLPDPLLMYRKKTKFRNSRHKTIMAGACSKYVNVINGAGICLFGAFLGADRLPLFEWLNAATGWTYSPTQYLQIGRNIQTVKQAFNVKQGLIPKNIAMSHRTLGRPPQKSGANKGRTIPIEKMRQSYWIEMGWDANTGIPTQPALRRAGIDTAAPIRLDKTVSRKPAKQAVIRRGPAAKAH